MNASRLNLLICLVHLCESAAIYKKNDTLEVLKKDVASVGGAIENFTFDLLREVFEDSEETTTVGNRRKARSTEDDVRELCRKRCQEEEAAETQQIKELKREVKKLQEVVEMLQDQQKIIDILDRRNETQESKETKRQEGDDEKIPNGQQLALIKSDLEEVIVRLNETKELIGLQKEKDEILEGELNRQKDEIESLKSLVEEILHGNRTKQDGASAHTSARASEFSGIRKLLKSLPDDDDIDEVDTDEIHSKILELEKQLKKKRREQSLASELKQLEKSLSGQNSGNSDLLKQIVKALRKTEPQSKSDDFGVTDLEDLQAAINNLRPKEDDDATRFETVLSKLINRSPNQRPSQITITPQQMNELTKKLTPNNYPYICIVDDGGVKSNGYRAPVNARNFQLYAPPPPDLNNQKGQQFFPGQFAQPNYYPQGSANGAPPEKPLNYPPENGEYNRKYRDDLMQQIDGLQGAIDSLNRPEYVQRPEDKTVIDDLEKQIGELRTVVGNLNYDQTYQAPRSKRSPEDNKVEEEFVEHVAKIAKKYLDQDEKPPHLQDIQNKIDVIRNELGGSNSKSRTASQQYTPPLFSDLYAPPPVTDVTKSAKNDFFLDVVGKILDKLIAAIPVVIQKLFSFSLDELSRYDYQDYDVQTLYKNLGIFAYLPVVLLRLVKGISSFMSILKKNSFFKNFLMPALILGTVAGSVIFLIWWLQPDDPVPQYSGGYGYDQSYAAPQNYAAQQQYPVSNYPMYNRSYFNK